MYKRHQDRLYESSKSTKTRHKNGKSVETEKKDKDSKYVATLKVSFVYFNATNSNLIWAGSLIG